MSDLLLAGRLLIAAVLAVAAVMKLVNRPAFRDTLIDFRVPAGPSGVLSLLIPLAELAIAVLLVPAPTATYAAFAALGLLIAFSAAVGSSLARGEQPDCGCFGASEPSPIGTSTLIRNVGLAAIAAAVAFLGPGTSPASVTMSATTVALAACFLAIAVLGFFCFQLFQQSGRLLERVDALELAQRLQAPRPASERNGRQRLEVQIRNEGRSPWSDDSVSLERN